MILSFSGLTGIGFLPVSALSPTLQARIKNEEVTTTFSRSAVHRYTGAGDPGDGRSGLA